MRRLRLPLIVAVAVLAVSGLSFAYWTASGSGSAAAAVATFSAPSNVQASTTTGSTSVSVSWNAAALSTGQPPDGYYVTRKNTATNAVSAACGSSAASLRTTTSCADASVPSGTYVYTVVSVFRSWTATSSASNSVTVQGDVTAPTSSASAPAYVKASPFTVSYTASDNPGGSGLSKVDLYVEKPGESAFTKVATASNPGATGSFSYSPPNGTNGSYAFYTVATDQAGNAESTSAAQTTTVYDTANPSSSLSGPQFAAGSNVSLTYTAADSGGSGLAKVELWMKKSTASSYTLAATDSSPGTSGTLTADTGAAGSVNDGSYLFYSVAYDKAGNAEATPSTQDATVVRDTVAPASSANAPNRLKTTTISVPWSATETGSGLSKVELYVKKPTDAAFPSSPTMTATTSATSGTFSYDSGATGAANDGTYSFYTVAYDNAGNTETAPATPDSTTVRDTVKPNPVTVTTTNGGTAGRLDAGDTITYGFDEAIDPATVLAGWSGASTTVQANFDGSNALTILNTSGTTLPLGSVALSGNYTGTPKTTFASSTMTMPTASTIKVTLVGTPSPDKRSAGSVATTTMIWTSPSTLAIADLAGNVQNASTRSVAAAQQF